MKTKNEKFLSPKTGLQISVNSTAQKCWEKQIKMIPSIAWKYLVQKEQEHMEFAKLHLLLSDPRKINLTELSESILTIQAIIRDL